MHQYRRDQLYLPTASSNYSQLQQDHAGDYQNYRKESAFRRLVSGALRNPAAERQRTKPVPNEYDSDVKRQTIIGPPETQPQSQRSDDRDRQRRSHRKSSYNQAPRQREDDDYRLPVDDRRHSKQSVRRPEQLKPLSSNPVGPLSTVELRGSRPVEQSRRPSTLDARRPYTTERLSQSSRHPQRSDY